MTPEKWGATRTPKIHGSRVRQLCRSKRILGAVCHWIGDRASWDIPEDAKRLPSRIRPRHADIILAPSKPVPMQYAEVDGVTWAKGPWRPVDEGYQYYEGNPFATAFSPKNPNHVEWMRGYNEALLADT